MDDLNSMLWVESLDQNVKTYRGFDYPQESSISAIETPKDETVTPRGLSKMFPTEPNIEVGLGST